MTYLITTPNPNAGRFARDPATIERLDVARFTRDLATALGPDATATTEGEHDVGGVIMINAAPDSIYGGPLKLTVWGSHTDREKVTIGVYPAGIPHEYAAGSMYHSDTSPTTLPKINISTTRPLVQIARDVHRRLLGEAIAPIATRRARAEAARQYADSSTSTADKLRAACPGLKVEQKDRHADTTIYINTGGLYITGRVQGDSISIDRIGSLSTERFVAAFAALTAPKAAE